MPRHCRGIEPTHDTLTLIQHMHTTQTHTWISSDRFQNPHTPVRNESGRLGIEQTRRHRHVDKATDTEANCSSRLLVFAPNRSACAAARFTAPACSVIKALGMPVDPEV